MALESLCSNAIVEGKKIALPRESLNGKKLKYQIDQEKREISFFYADNGEMDVFALNIWTAPKGAREMEFRIYQENILEAPVFYYLEGEILKIGNR